MLSIKSKYLEGDLLCVCCSEGDGAGLFESRNESGVLLSSLEQSAAERSDITGVRLSFKVDQLKLGIPDVCDVGIWCDAKPVASGRLRRTCLSF